jgi:hypothetical protein
LKEILKNWNKQWKDQRLHWMMHFNQEVFDYLMRMEYVSVDYDMFDIITAKFLLKENKHMFELRGNASFDLFAIDGIYFDEYFKLPELETKKISRCFSTFPFKKMSDELYGIETEGNYV